MTSVIPFDRNVGIGGSDVPAIVGMSPYRSALDLWSEKRGESIDRPPNVAMRIGTLLEDGIARLYAEQEGVRIARVGRVGPVEQVKQPVRRSSGIPKLVPVELGFPAYANIDRRRIGKPVVGVEVKHTSLLDRFTNGVPDDVAVQVQFYMLLTGWQAFDVVSLSGGRNLAVQRVQADQDAMIAIVEACRSFWQHVVDGTPPDPDGSSSASDYLKRRYPREAEGTEIVATHDMLPMIADLLGTAQIRKRTERDFEQAKQRVQMLMGEASTLTFANGKITWRSQLKTDVDWRFLAELAGTRLMQANLITERDWTELVDGATTQKPSRVFRINAKGIE